ncbi:MAG: NADH-quinone oxidoreductase subunit J [Chloroflexi bacterium]|nr:NADH-quinone oxidoreductase subunit J [Chloroflexota bacterium]
MSPEQIIFGIAGALALVGAANATFRRDPLAGAISLIVTLFALAVLYLGLGAEFLAAVQVAIYAGAIMALFVIVIMLIGPAAGRARGPRLVIPAAVVALSLFGLLAAAILGGRIPDPTQGVPADDLAALADTVYVRYLLAFEVTSVLLLAALVAALVMVRKRSTEREWPRR